MADTVPSDLAQRLLRRVTGPAGVVDVRGAQERYERAAAWPRRHLTLLERSAARAAVDTAPDQGPSLLLAQRAGEASPVQSFLTGGRGLDPGPEPPARPAVIAPAERVARPRPGSEPAAGPTLAATRRGELIVGPAMHAVSRSSAEVPRAARFDVPGASTVNSGAAPAPVRQALSLPHPEAAITPPDTASQVERLPVTVRSRPVAQPSAPPSSDVLVQRLRTAAGTAAVQTAQRAGNGVAPGAERHHAGAEPVAVVASPQVIAAPPQVMSMTVEMPVARAHDVRPVAAPGDLHEPSSASDWPRATVPSPDGAAEVSRRSHAPADIGGAAGPSEVRAVATPVIGRHSSDPAPPPMVWRRGAETDARSALSSRSGRAPQAAAAHLLSSPPSLLASSVDAAPGAIAAPPAGAAPAGSGERLDFERVVDEVTRRIVAQGIVQRERRGVS
jgi:hypothetical protein